MNEGIKITQVTPLLLSTFPTRPKQHQLIMTRLVRVLFAQRRCDVLYHSSAPCLLLSRVLTAGITYFPSVDMAYLSRDEALGKVCEGERSMAGPRLSAAGKENFPSLQHALEWISSFKNTSELGKRSCSSVCTLVIRNTEVVPKNCIGKELFWCFDISKYMNFNMPYKQIYNWKWDDRFFYEMNSCDFIHLLMNYRWVLLLFL